jgi:hypothetical protein
MSNFISNSIDTYSSLTRREKMIARIGAVAIVLCGAGMLEGFANNYVGTDTLSCFGSTELAIPANASFIQALSDSANRLHTSPADLQPILIAENDNNVFFGPRGLTFNVSSSATYESPTNCSK